MVLQTPKQLLYLSTTSVDTYSKSRIFVRPFHVASSVRWSSQEFAEIKYLVESVICRMAYDLCRIQTPSDVLAALDLYLCDLSENQIKEGKLIQVCSMQVK